MSKNDLTVRVSLTLFLSGVAAASASAGSAVIGSVAGSMNATIGGQPLIVHTTIFSGDSVQVNDGAAVVALDGSSRMAFGRQTTVSFLRDSNEVTVLLSRGNLSMYHTQDGAALRVKVGDVTVLPAKGFKTLGDVAMVGGSVVITAKEGSFQVKGSGPALEVAKGKTITIPVNPARAASPSPAKPPFGPGGGTLLEAGALGAGATSAILAAIAISRATDARDAANAADAGVKAAIAAANAANSTANSVGCALNVLAADQGFASPYTPPSGSTCP